MTAKAKRWRLALAHRHRLSLGSHTLGASMHILMTCDDTECMHAVSARENTLSPTHRERERQREEGTHTHAHTHTLTHTHEYIIHCLRA
jgi:hypothetical protein